MGKGKVIVFSNKKGGVGKTSDTDMTALVASQLFHRKVLLIDVDQQANTTASMVRTFGEKRFKKSFAKCVEDGSLKGGITPLSPWLDMIAGSGNESELNEIIYRGSKSKSDQYRVLKPLIDEIRDDYDYIFFDVAPSLDTTLYSIFYATDYIIIVQEVKRFSMDGASVLIDELQKFLNRYKKEVNYEILGILPAILRRRRKQQLKNYQETVDQYGASEVFSTIIKSHDRIEGFGEEGIKLDDVEDRKIWALFADLFMEIEARIAYFEKYGDIEGFTYELQYYNSKKNRTLKLGKEINYHDGIIKQG